MNLEELSGIVKNECACMYFATGMDETIPYIWRGVDSYAESDVLHGALVPWGNYGPISRMFVPGLLGKAIRNTNTRFVQPWDNHLHLFHYDVNWARARKHVQKFREYNCPEISQGWPDKWEQKFGDASCLWTPMWHYPIIAGNKNVMEKVTGYIKEAHANIFNLLIEILDRKSARIVAKDIGKEANDANGKYRYLYQKYANFGFTSADKLADKWTGIHEQDIQRIEGVHIYDTLNKPKEVHLIR